MIRFRPRLRLWLWSAWLAVVASSSGWAQAVPFHAGVTRIAVDDVGQSFEALVVYPTDAAETPLRMGPFSLSANIGAPVAALPSGALLPVVLFSHGSGKTAGTPLLHRELLLHLARNGFIVVAPFHLATKLPFVDRPRQIRRALETVLTDPRFAAQANVTQVGMIGFSFGGAVALLSAGAGLNMAHLSAYCHDHRDDRRACEGVQTDGSLSYVPTRRSADVVRLRALILLEPLGAVFDPGSLSAVNMPVLIYNATGSDLRTDGNASAIARGLGHEPARQAVPGGHFIFVDPCPPTLAAEAPDLCRDSSGIDREAIQRQIRSSITAFLRRTLQ